MLFLVGSGGDGKAMEALLDQGVLGQHNCAYLDSDIFYSKSEFRKSGHFALDKLAIRIQEFQNGKSLCSDTWKKFISGETMDLR